MDYLTAIHVALTVLRYQLRVALVVQMLLIWYVDILGRILQRTIELTKQILKPVDLVLKFSDLLRNAKTGGAIDVGVTSIKSKARTEAMHLSKEFHMLPLKLQELELLIFSAARHIIIASQGTVYMQPSSSPSNAPLTKLSSNAAQKLKQFMNYSEKPKTRSFSNDKSAWESTSKKWMPTNTTANGSKNVNCEVNTVNSARSHILPSPKISEAYAEEVTSLTLSKASDAPGQLPVVQQVPFMEKNDEFPARGLDSNAWNFSELKGLWADRKRSRKEDVSDRESLRSIAESNITQQS